jgi:hypothetical protein
MTLLLAANVVSAASFHFSFGAPVQCPNPLFIPSLILITRCHLS